MSRVKRTSYHERSGYESLTIEEKNIVETWETMKTRRDRIWDEYYRSPDKRRRDVLLDALQDLDSKPCAHDRDWSSECLECSMIEKKCSPESFCSREDCYNALDLDQPDTLCSDCKPS